MEGFAKASLLQAQETLERFIARPENVLAVEEGTRLMVEGLRSQSRIFSCGNGGSLCDSMHFAEELTGRYRKDRASLPALSIADPAHMTCVANDFGYSHVFSRFLEGWAKEGDVLLAISTSGNSENVINAAEVATQKKLKVIGLLGKTGGKLKDKVDLPIIVDSPITDRIQEIHIKIIHLFIEGIERSLFPENYS